ncbi:excalibur calcium-binding domain-containing protein [Glycomyces paridis]|uniref:excalibur calcium-binding domain-containing protein n=1 Tax=Glycomyces paridis TaxID=2126555 RepID=UPI00195D883C|nr:excalibur calcium-binding domain-containing protein [Glycomyces paridis]
MSVPPQGPPRKGVKPWSQLSTGEKSAVISILVVPVLCCAGILSMIGGDNSDPDSFADTGTVEATTEEATTAAPSTSEPSPTETEPTTSAAPTEAAEPEPEPEPEPEVYYDNCDDARDAGAAPLYEDDPGYRAGLDGDGDGEACEDTSSSGGGGGGDDGGDDGDSGDVYYKNCDAVRAAGAAPIHAGEPGYGSHLDRDGDGTACE